MDHDKKLIMVNYMRRYGGSFVVALAELFILADSNNLERLYKAFPEIVERYSNMVAIAPHPSNKEEGLQ